MSWHSSHSCALHHLSSALCFEVSFPSCFPFTCKCFLPGSPATMPGFIFSSLETWDKQEPMDCWAHAKAIIQRMMVVSHSAIAELPSHCAHNEVEGRILFPISAGLFHRQATSQSASYEKKPKGPDCRLQKWPPIKPDFILIVIFNPRLSQV